MKYIRTEDRIIDVDAELEKAKNRYNETDRGHVFEKIHSFKLKKDNEMEKLYAIPLNEQGKVMRDLSCYNFFSINVEDILNQGDEIEPLCDGILYEYYHFPTSKVQRKLYESISELQNNIIDFNSGLEKVYGYIATNEGLIYVAEMNKDRKLCLI